MPSKGTKEQRMETTDRPMEPVPAWDSSDYLIVNDFDRLAGRRIELKELRDRIDREISGLNDELGAMLATARMSSVRFGDYRLTLGFSWRGGRLSKTRLLEMGVSSEVLEAATTPKEPGESYISVTPMKSEKGEKVDPGER